jgi:MYXO-CTERM domain-containing protein
MLAALTLSGPARADIPPEDQCLEYMVGKACNNAEGEGAQFQPGVCTQAMCTRATPDGSMTYACYRCVAEGEGTGGQSGDAGSSAGGEVSSAGTVATSGAPGAGSGGASATGGSGTAGTKPAAAGSAAEPASDSDGGCSVSQAGGGAGAFAALVGLGLAAVGLLRRRSS